MKKKAVAIVTLILIIVVAIIIVQKDEDKQGLEESREKYSSIVVDRTINGEIIGNLDRTTYDKDVMCIGIEKDKLKVIPANLDGDEVDLTKEDYEYLNVTKGTKFYREKMETKVASDNKRETTITYKKAGMENLKMQIEENVFPANMHVWLDKKGNVENVIMYECTEIWE